jgi:hypothetical protein
MGEPLGFLQHFRDLLRTRSIRFAITSGMACVHYGIQQTTKDTDWIVDPGHLDRLRALLRDQQRNVPPWRVAYRTVFGAPLHESWMRHGWTSHILVQETALAAEQHLDFFARPPRVATWAPTADGFADRDLVAHMKRTDRERDWPIIDGLGWQIAASGGSLASALLHVQSPSRLQAVWQQASASERAAAAERRPLLRRLADETDSDRLEAWVRLERLVWQCINRERYGRYQEAWKAFYRRWRAEPDWSWPTAEPFEVQHERLVAAAQRHGLVQDPLAGVDDARLCEAAINKAATVSFASVEQLRSVAPGPKEILR